MEIHIIYYIELGTITHKTHIIKKLTLMTIHIDMIQVMEIMQVLLQIS